MASSSSTSSSLPKEEKILRLESGDGECFDITGSEAAQSVLLKNMVSSEETKTYYSTKQGSAPPTDDDGAYAAGKDDSVTLRNINGRTLAAVTAYLKIHADTQVSVEDKDMHDVEGIGSRSLDELFSIFLAADYLEIESLFGVAAKGIADHIKDFSVEKFRHIFHIQNDFTPEEEDLLRQEHPWAHIFF